MKKPSRRNPPVRGTLLGLLALAAVSSLPATAQVNTEALRAGVETPGFSGSLDLSLSLREGNTDTLNAGGGLRLQQVRVSEACMDLLAEEAVATGAEKGGEDDGSSAETEDTAAESDTIPPGPCYARRVVFLVGRFSFSEENDERSVNQSFEHLRWVRARGPRIAGEAFLQHQFNEFQRLDTRVLLGGGGRFALRREKTLQAFLGSGLMWEFERLDLPEVQQDERDERTVRWTNYLTLRYAAPDRPVRMAATFYAQPSLEAFSDVRLLFEGELEVELSRRLSLGLAASVSHDSEPPPGVEETDLALVNKLGIRF